jgi:hypothetical protein
MSKIKDFYLDVEAMIRAGKTAKEISIETAFPLDFIESIIITLELDQPEYKEEDNA